MSKIKEHWNNHKEKYYIGAIAFLYGAAIGATLVINSKNKQIAEMMNSANISNYQGIAINSPIHNDISIEIYSKVDPGWIVQDVESGTIYASQNEAARALGVSPTTVSGHLTGKFDNAGGRKLARIAKAPVSQE